MVLPVNVAPVWYGPSTVDQRLSIAGNPFDSVQNDVRCVFTRKGVRLVRLAYFAHGAWHATLAAKKGGPYRARFTLNGKPVGKPSGLTLLPSKDNGFVRLDGLRFRLESGGPYVPLGHNFGWEAKVSYPRQLADMKGAGLNWTRVWADAWDGKNPYVPKDAKRKLPLGRMDESALDRWAMIVRECEKHDLKMQLVLFHHGLFSTTVNSNWGEHPWNKANGGFLARAIDFFSDPTAKRLTRAWLRYAVARYGHSPSIMAWELFNEVQWTDAAKDPKRIGDVIAWHKAMGDYLRSIDPYRHLVTSSSNENLDPRVFATMDYDQPHVYPPSVYGALLATPAARDKPLFYGELGAQDAKDTGANEYRVVRDGIWGGLLGGHAGPGQYWSWDRAYSNDLYSEYARESKVLARSGFAGNPKAVPAPITVEGAPKVDLAAAPSLGWGKAERFVYRLPGDASTGTLTGMPSFVQGTGHRDMMREPIRLLFDAPKAGRATFRVGQSSAGGGTLRISVNGKVAFLKAYPKAAQNTDVKADVVAEYPAGPVEIAIENPGEDWVTLESVKVEGIGSGVSSASLRTDRYALVRLTWPSGFGPDAKTVTMQGLRDGGYEMRQFNLDSGEEKISTVRIERGTITGYVPFGKDEAVALFAK